MNKQIINRLTNCLLKCCPKLKTDFRPHLKTIHNQNNDIIFRYFSQSSNQKIISLNTNQTNSDNNQRIDDKTKANICVTFVRNDGKRLTGFGKEGDNLLDVVINNDIDLDGFGACEGTLACSTCHLIFTTEDFNKIGDKASDEELDMLDLAFELTDTSRLGCQVVINKGMDGLVVRVPDSVNDVRTT